MEIALFQAKIAILANFGEYCAALMSPEIIFLHVTIDNVSTGYLKVNFMKKIQKISTLWGITYVKEYV